MASKVNEPKGGVLVWVYRKADRKPGTRQISDRHSQFILIGDGLDTTFSTTEEIPPLRLRRGGQSGDHLFAEPLDPPVGGYAYAFGGNFIYSSDSRFPASHPIPIHDFVVTR